MTRNLTLAAVIALLGVLLISIHWISRELREFRAANPRTPRDHLDHQAFDAWLESRYPSPVVDDGQFALFQEAEL